MKILKRSLFLSILTTARVLYADLDEPTFSQEANPPEKDSYPFTIEADANLIGSSKLDKKGFHGQHMKFSLVDVDASMVFHYDKCLNEGAYGELGYTSTKLEWKHNPYFQEQDFNTINLSVGGFTERWQDWRLLGQVTVHIDPIEDFNLADYTYYDIVLWGRYRYCHGIGLNMGFILITGMKIDRLYPIIGVDWKINNTWELNAVFPVNVSLVYKIDECWSCSLAGRTFDIRHRVAKDEPLSRGLFTYRNCGAELVLKYACDSRIEADIHVGYTTGGRFKVANRHYEDRQRFKLGAAPYGGSEILVKF